MKSWRLKIWATYGVNIFTSVVEDSDINAFLHSRQCGRKQRNCCYEKWNLELHKNAKLWNYITLAVVIRYENTVNIHVTEIQQLVREPFSIFNGNMFLRTVWSWSKHEEKSGAERGLWICRLSQREMKAIILKIFMNLLNFTYESHPLLIICINLFSRLIGFQPGAFWTLHFKYTVWWI